jgi:hypothetical protein
MSSIFGTCTGKHSSPRTLPVRDRRQLVAIRTIRSDGQDTKDPLSVAMFEQFRATELFSQLFAWDAMPSGYPTSAGLTRTPE